MLMITARGYSKTLVHNYQTVFCHIPVAVTFRNVDIKKKEKYYAILLVLKNMKNHAYII